MGTCDSFNLYNLIVAKVKHHPIPYYGFRVVLFLY